MLLIVLLVGWIVVAPALVVGGLYLASGLLGRRSRPAGPDAGWFARELAELQSPSSTPASGSGVRVRPVAH